MSLAKEFRESKMYGALTDEERGDLTNAIEQGDSETITTIKGLLAAEKQPLQIYGGAVVKLVEHISDNAIREARVNDLKTTSAVAEREDQAKADGLIKNY